MTMKLNERFIKKYDHDNTFIISHGKCNDGLASAHIATHFLSEWKGTPFPDDRVFFLEHSNDHIGLFDKENIWDKLDEATDTITLIVLDFSLSPEVLGMLYGRYPNINIIILDHHKSAIDMYTEKAFKETFKYMIRNNQFQFMYSTKYSGAILSYCFFAICGPLGDVYMDHLDWFNYEEVSSDVISTWIDDGEFPEWVKYIHDRDTWSWQFTNSRPFTTMFMRKVKTLGDIRKLLPFNGCLIGIPAVSNTREWCRVGDEICEYMDELTEEVSLDAEKVSLVIDGVIHNGVILNTSNCFTSDVGNLLSKDPNIDFAVMYRVTDKGEVKVGLRSHENFNCIPVAKHWNGGGHPQASGCRFNTLLDFVNQMYQPLKDGFVTIS